MQNQINLNEYQLRCGERQKNIVSRDEGHSWKHTGINKDQSKVRHFKIDGEVLPHGQVPERCDFLLVNDEKKTAYFIELKGSPSDAMKCVDQVENTEFMCRASLQGYKSFYRFVFGPGHGVYPSEFIAWRNKKAKGTVIAKRADITEDI